MPITGGLPSTEAFPLAEKAARRALDIDPSNAEAYSVLGTKAFWYDWDYAAAERHLLKALELQPSHADSHLFLGHLYSNIGRADEALREIRRTRDLDSQWAQPRALEGQFLTMARRYDEALAHLDTVANVTDPTLWTAHAFKADALLALGRAEEALRASDRTMELPSSPFQRSQRGYFLARAGRRAEAEAALATMPAKQAYSRALVQHALGRDEAAIAELNRAVDDRTVLVTFVGVDPKWDALRAFQPFRDVARRVNLLDVSDRTAALVRSRR